MPPQRRLVRFNLTDHTHEPGFIDGQEPPKWRDGPEMIDYINQLGHEKWHLAGAAIGLELIFEQVQ